jgi:hypothetical protein
VVLVVVAQALLGRTLSLAQSQPLAVDMEQAKVTLHLQREAVALAVVVQQITALLGLEILLVPLPRRETMVVLVVTPTTKVVQVEVVQVQ